MYRIRKHRGVETSESGGSVSFDADIRTIFLEGEIDIPDVSSFYQAVAKLVAIKKTPIRILINSGGGGVIESMAIIDIIESTRNIEFHALVTGLCCSAASLIVCSCDKRSATKRSTFMIHEMTNHVEARYTELRAEVRMNDIWMRNIVEIYTNGTGQDPEFIRETLLQTKWMSSQEAVEFGLIDNVVESLTFPKRGSK